MKPTFLNKHAEMKRTQEAVMDGNLCELLPSTSLYI